MDGGIKQAASAAMRYLPAIAPRWASPIRRFVIVTVGRTGSELLVNLLDRHPRVVCEGEILALRPRFPRQYARARAARAGWHGAEAYGWKLLTGHFMDGTDSSVTADAAERYIAGLVEDGHRIILLERRDHLQQAISWYRAHHGRFHYRHGDDEAYVPVEVDPELLLRAASTNEVASDQLRVSVKVVPHLRLVYEDDLLDPVRHQHTLDSVCAFLGIASAPASTEYIKVAPRHTQELVSNWPAIEECFRNSGCAHLLGY